MILEKVTRIDRNHVEVVVDGKEHIFDLDLSLKEMRRRVIAEKHIISYHENTKFKRLKALEGTDINATD